MRWTRLRWRIRGAWMWPAFLALTVADGLLIHALPIAGDRTGVVAGMLLAGFFNLVAVAVGAPLAGRLVRRRRPDLPAVVANDYAGTVLLLVVAGVVLAAGLVHRPAIDEQERDFAAQSAAVREYVMRQVPRLRANLDRANSLRLDTDLYRTCVPGRDPRRDFCLIVSTDQSPPGIRRDPNREPNESFRRGG